jgi:hypothetical protein
MAYALKQKKCLSVVSACQKKDVKWALMVCDKPDLVENEKLADVNATDDLGWTPLHYAGL